MKKDDINAKLRAFVRESLSPTKEEKSLVSAIYESVCEVLGSNKCLQIGSYPRYTAIRPMHDLDVLYIVGSWTPDADPRETLENLKSKLDADYKNPTDLSPSISLQSHSVTISFSDGRDEVFAVDVVPAYADGKNSHGEDKYRVPEVLRKDHKKRQAFMEKLAKTGEPMTWIPSDPRGYITQARDLNGINADFRKSVKLVKAWRYACKDYRDDFPLKSFHLELLITDFFKSHPKTEIFDAIFYLFCHLPEFISKPRLRDKADPDRFVDAYIAELSEDQRTLAIRLRDHFLITLEAIDEDMPVSSLIAAAERHRASDSESYLFDFGIPVLTETTLTIVGNVQQRQGGFRPRILDIFGVIEVDRKINFELGPQPLTCPPSVPRS